MLTAAALWAATASRVQRRLRKPERGFQHGEYADRNQAVTQAAPTLTSSAR